MKLHVMQRLGDDRITLHTADGGQWSITEDYATGDLVIGRVGRKLQVVEYAPITNGVMIRLHPIMPDGGPCKYKYLSLRGKWERKHPHALRARLARAEDMSVGGRVCSMWADHPDWSAQLIANAVNEGWPSGQERD